MPWPSWLFWRGPEEPDPPNPAPKPAKEAQPPPPPPKETPILPTTKTTSWDKSLNRTDWSHYTTPQTLILSAITTLTTLALIRTYKTYLRRIPTASYLKPGFFRHRNLYGFVTRVGDGDNFHLFHTPGGRWLGWGWAPGRRVKEWKEKEVRGKTIHVRIAGVDAPEAAHFGRPAQPWSAEALEWLRGAVLGRFVRVYPFRNDQYSRVVCAVYRRRWGLWRQDVGLLMLRRGLATVYEAKFGSEFGDKEAEYRAAEAEAKERRVGMWQEPGIVGRMLGRKGSFESPREYKTRMAKQEKTGDLAK